MSQKNFAAILEHSGQLKKPGLELPQNPRCLSDEIMTQTKKRKTIGHFQVPPGLCYKTRIVAQPLLWKSFFILMRIKLIFTRKVVHLASFSQGGFLELGSGLSRQEEAIKFIERP